MTSNCGVVGWNVGEEEGSLVGLELLRVGRTEGDVVGEFVGGVVG